jgi:hypothetical protein
MLRDKLGVPQIFAINHSRPTSGPDLGGSRADKMDKHSPQPAGMRKFAARP